MKNTCYACLKSDPRRILSLGLHYLSKFDTKSKKYPLTLVYCEGCKLVQLRDFTPLNILYSDDYGYYSGINETMREHLAEIVNIAQKFTDVKKGDVVVDIGANDGTLLENYSKDIIKIAFEPVPKFSKFYTKMQNTVYVNDFFNKDSYERALNGNYRLAKIITAISMFYDLPNPNEFLVDIDEILAPEGIFIVQQNYLLGMLNQNAFDNIVHEHLQYYSLTSMENLLKKFNLEIVDVEENDLNGGSFRTYIAHKGDFVPTPIVSVMRQVEKRIRWPKVLKKFAKNVKEGNKRLKEFVSSEVDAGKTIYVYGASTRGNTLLQAAGLNQQLISKAVERNPDKFGKRITSLDIPIISEEQARREHPDYFLVLPWFFKEEFVKREKDYLASGGRLIFPLPEFEVVGGE